MNPTENDRGSWRQLLQDLSNQWPLARWRDVGVVVGCSGGADSVALLRCLSDLRTESKDQPRGSLIAAHFNHNLRGAESDEDQAFVETLAKQLDVRFVSERGDGKQRDESSLRTARLQFLVASAKRFGARYVALAHSSEDNVETLLHHLFRGTGPAGLAGIGSPRPIEQDFVLIRPLLNMGRERIREALRSIDQPWREDSSNAQIDYRRNWIRHRLLPLIESEYPNAADAIGRTIGAQRQWRGIIDQLASRWLESQCSARDPLTIRRDPTADAAVVVAATQILWSEQGWPRGDMGQEQWNRLSETLRSESLHRYTLPGDIDVDASGAAVVLRLSGREKD
ncbi:MAG: tRNA lysidine(34) synthetase TilS [Rubripirellula sp.]